MNQAQEIQAEQRRNSIRTFEGMFLSSFLSQSRCRIRHLDGRLAEISLVQGSDMAWEIREAPGSVEVYSSIPEILEAGWLAE